MKVLVTGGAGFIGSHISDKLIENGHEVVIIDDLSSGKKENINPKAIFYKLDIKDKDGLEKVFIIEKPDIVSHHAAQADVVKSMNDPSFDAKINILGSLNIIQPCIKYNVQKIIFASTSVVYPDTNELPTKENYLIKPISAYGVTKYVVECYLQLFYESCGLRYTAFRYGNVYGPRQNPNGESGVIAIFSKQLSSGKTPTIFGDGNKTRDYVHIDDVVSVNMLVLDKSGDGNVYNIGCGKEIKDIEVFNAIKKTLRVNIDPIFAKKRKGEHSRVCLDSNKAEKELVWKPKVAFEEGILQTVSYYSNLICNK